MTRIGNVLEPGDIVLAKVQFVDTAESKARPALVLFEEYGNIVVAGITSNPEMKGIALTKKDGAIKDSVIKLNYIFTVSQDAVERRLFKLGKEKKKDVFRALCARLAGLEK